MQSRENVMAEFNGSAKTIARRNQGIVRYKGFALTKRRQTYHGVDPGNGIGVRQGERNVVFGPQRTPNMNHIAQMAWWVC